MRPSKAAAKLSVTIGTLANWRTKQIGPPFYRVGGLVLYADDEVDRWIASGRQSMSHSADPIA
jgi:hypothetical protein